MKELTAHELVELGIVYPEWIMPVDSETIREIAVYGCASGCYMPAVTYSTAKQTMQEHGESVVTYLEDTGYSFTFDPTEHSWAGFCCDVLSAAVEHWAYLTLQLIEELEQDDE